MTAVPAPPGPLLASSDVVWSEGETLSFLDHALDVIANVVGRHLR